ncbi:hypothetical protein ONN20_13950 [Salmonella enterica subsp. enterica serovar Virginia]|uniref:hypothetical protein n=1 Tax=Salmonella enterica TaxID=28901 RepID=UPI001CCB2F2C|nr:hypothetical protein [Salmonella enterica]MEA5677334.1 hypothetical protein [Salmonella enterica subsp. enterica serovar Virginia]MEA7660234.1 hypothetical protein [Salmonella enterica subsp. enterica serovar Altona]MDI4836126.1 hypothetical protein [Salmonella enterica subsp. enterica serovar Muenchen]MDI4859093.1 hypothetical protein [Salmonella enterica subsp. enterica serovar Muenchen]MDI4877895.1 hypothetical protein [Salmonella enterica subsp. enterica serovar Muenchen]
MSNIDKQAVTAKTKELASLMVEGFSMNPVSCKLLNEAWEKEFPDEVAIAERMLALLDELEHYKSREERVTKLVLDNSTSWDALYKKLEAAERQNGYLREQRDEWERKAISNFEECAEMSARIEELEAQRKLAFTASNRWADKFREAEKHIAELEAKLETADRLQDGAFRSGLKAGFSYGQTDDQSGFMQCMSAYSPRAGIKVKE